jgi:hypothetical protein
MPTDPFQAFNYRDEQGRARTARSSADAPGRAGYQSAALRPDGLSTEQGDAANPFRGYVGPDGGTFGGYDSIVDERYRNADNPNGMTQAQYDTRVADATQNLRTQRPVDWSRTAQAGQPVAWANGSRNYINTTSAGVPGGLDARDALQRRMALDGDTNFTEDERAALTAELGGTDNPFRSAADMVRLGYDTQGNRVAEGADRFERLVAAGLMTPEQAGQQRTQYEAQIAREQNPEPVNADPFGRFDDPTAANNVIRPTAATPQAPQDRLLSPSLSPRTPMPAAQTDPFAPFQPNVTPQGTPGQPPGITGLAQGVQPTNFAQGTPNGVTQLNGAMANTLNPNTPATDLGGFQPATPSWPSGPSDGPGGLPVGGNRPTGGAVSPLAPATSRTLSAPGTSPLSVGRRGFGGALNRAQARFRPVRQGQSTAQGQPAQPTATPLV